ncbi:hypothetical protein CWATWH0401_1523 [Crocosphaera watsonii WH 0401]|uniref:Uncharacterized protein n=1 Tax=Crocosphaera watsonii WH 0401 TaxID=555881 RepID=T2JGM3_CROWT|nr:hypothetical protein CWATWH0401_1523 [Crocosphaera watsonii WH 0401]
MASPIGHSLAGFFGFFLVRENAEFFEVLFIKKIDYNCYHSR